jgi:hypothetical protein
MTAGSGPTIGSTVRSNAPESDPAIPDKDPSRLTTNPLKSGSGKWTDFFMAVDSYLY